MSKKVLSGISILLFLAVSFSSNAQNSIQNNKDTIIASIYLDLVLAVKIQYFKNKFLESHPDLKKDSLAVEDMVKYTFNSISDEDSGNKTRLSEVLDVQKKRFAIYSFDGCNQGILSSLQCEPKVTCPVGGTPPCCQNQRTKDDKDVKNYKDILLDGKLQKEFFRNIVYWNDNEIIEAYDEKDTKLNGVITTIGVIENLRIKKIDFSIIFDKIKYIKINDPNVLIQVPSN